MSYQEKHASHEGRKVEYKGISYTIGALLERMGKLKTGEEQPYVELIAADGKNIEMHPRKAVDLFTKGEADGIKLLVEQVAAEGETTAVAPIVEAAAPVAPAAPVAAAPAVPAAPKEPSKKAQCVKFYHDGIEAKLDRKAILAQFATVGVTGPGAATYYQNCKSGKAGWTAPVVVAETAAVEAVATTEVAPVATEVATA